MNKKYLVYGGLAVVAVLLLSKRTAGTGILGFSAPPPPNPTASNVAAVGVATGGILAGLRGLFGGTAAPLSGGTAPNANDLTAQGQADLASGAYGTDISNLPYGDLSGDTTL